jgi:phage baseplate assembly protein W
MADHDTPTHFLGRGWAFPPTFEAGELTPEGAVMRLGGARMSEDEADIAQSLHILFGTKPGERLLQPDYGVDLGALLFEPLSTTLRTLVTDRVRLAILRHEPRIQLLQLAVDDSRALEGVLSIRLEYSVRSTNSRFNLVHPFYLGDANELRPSTAGA